MENEDNKLAEEILAKFIEKLDYTYRYKTINERKNIINELRYLMQAYHEAKMKEVTDDDIEAHTESMFVLANLFSDAPKELLHKLKSFYMDGAKAMQNGEIKHNG